MLSSDSLESWARIGSSTKVVSPSVPKTLASMVSKSFRGRQRVRLLTDVGRGVCAAEGSLSIGAIRGWVGLLCCLFLVVFARVGLGFLGCFAC